MNITPQSNHSPIQTAVNLQTDSLRRDNQQREIITKPEPSAQSSAEKGVASDKERGRTPAQNNEQVDFASLRKQAELANNEIGSGTSGSGQESSQGNGTNDDSSDDKNTSAQDQDSVRSEQDTSKDDYAEKQIIRNLESRDKEVRNHERAHASVGGAFTGSPSYSFEIGPNGKKYAVGGEVSVDVTPVAGNPKETIAKMKKIQAAALAPANPSAQDVRVAATASSIILESQAELISLNSADTEKKPSTGNLYRDKEVLLQSDESFENNESSKAFDRHIAQTLSAQEAIVPSRPIAVDERAGRIEQFYSNINHAYDQRTNYQFELIA